MGPFAQPIWLQFDVDHWLLPIMLHPCLVHSSPHFYKVALGAHCAFVKVLTQVDV
jgi:hypothetical protein